MDDKAIVDITQRTGDGTAAAATESKTKKGATRGSVAYSGVDLKSWPTCAGCNKKMVYDEATSVMWYCKTCDGYGVD